MSVWPAFGSSDWGGQCNAARSSAEHGERAGWQLALAHCWLVSVCLSSCQGLQVCLTHISSGCGMVWYRSVVTQVVFGATGHSEQSLPEECLPSISRRSCQHWQGVSGGTSLTFSQRVLRPVCFSKIHSEHLCESQSLFLSQMACVIWM